MNVYDFDKTIFYPDSSFYFILYELKRRPGEVVSTLPAVLMPFIRWRSGKITTTEFKQKLFSFLGKIDKPEDDVEAFWQKNIGRVQAWYLAQKKDDDLIISASPEFLLEPVSRKFGFALIGTRMDIHSGSITGLNCHDSEKVNRYRAAYADTPIEEFYSDSLSDTPMAEIAQKAFIVKKEKLSEWPG